MKQNKAMRKLALVSVLALSVAGCAKEEILDGLREDIRSSDYDVNDPNAVAAATEAAAQLDAPFENQSRPTNLGPVVTQASWPLRGANAAHNLPNATLSSSPSVIWSARAGEGNSKRNRITAEPVSDGANVFVMDSHTTVSAIGMGGAAGWSVDISAEGETAGRGIGGGLALGDGKLFATSTYGELVALDPSTGDVLWRQRFNASVSGAPTVVGQQVFVVTDNSEAYAINTNTGRIDWQLTGLASQYGVAAVAAPAVSGNTVLMPLSNGSLLGVDSRSGTVKFVSRMLGGRRGSGHAALQDFTGEPVVVGGVIYAANAAGQTQAISLVGGQTRWSVEEGAQGSIAVAGGSLYFVNDQGKLLRLSAQNGDKIWSIDLPHYEKEDNLRRRKSIYPGFGPVMAGGRLWVASGDGFLRAFDPTDGSQVASVELPEGAASRPITVAGKMFVMGEKGNLLALR
ncbi:MAG: PQQ-binding-like beta-propeller repeat protein [Maritimibacter sp.]